MNYETCIKNYCSYSIDKQNCYLIYDRFCDIFKSNETTPIEQIKNSAQTESNSDSDKSKLTYNALTNYNLSNIENNNNNENNNNIENNNINNNNNIPLINKYTTVSILNKTQVNQNSTVSNSDDTFKL